MYVFIITGACGSGKTTVSEYLRNHYFLNNAVPIINFDDVLGYREITIAWRQRSLKKLIEILNGYRKREVKMAIVEGMILPDDLLEYVKDIDGLDIYFILLELSPRTRKKRLQQRNAPSFLVEDTTNLMELRKEIKKYPHRIINTDGVTKEIVGSLIYEYIIEITKMGGISDEMDTLKDV